MKRILNVFVVLAVAIIFSACNNVPQTEVDAAGVALEQAKTAQADVYFTNEFFALQDSLNACIASVEGEKSKSIGNYDQVKAKLQLITDEATSLTTMTETRKEEIKTDLATAQAEISSLLLENNQLLTTVLKNKDGKDAFETIRTELEGVNNTVSELPGLIENGELLDAQSKINVAKEKAASINNELKQVIDKNLKKS